VCIGATPMIWTSYMILLLFPYYGVCWVVHVLWFYTSYSNKKRV
jgi:hypothetical protein